MAVNQSVIDKLVKQILASSDTAKWSGQGFGSAEANAADMAKILSGIGITDLSQFGLIKKTIPAQEQQVESGDGFTTVLVPEHTVTTYGNKLTNQEVPNTYGERQTDNAFGGTYAGKGNTAYRVSFDAQGNPQFYTTGASSSNLKDYAPLLAIGGLALGAPYLSELFGGAGAATGLTASELAAADMALGGAGGTAGATALSNAATAGTLGTGGLLTSTVAPSTTGLTTAELAQLDLATGGAGGTLGAETLANAITTGAEVPTLTNLTGGSGLLTGTAGGITADTVAQKLAADAASQAIASKLGVSLPNYWEALGPQDKISWLNANNISAEQLLNAGVPASDVSWMAQNGLGTAATTTAGTTGALTNAATTGGTTGATTAATTGATTGALTTAAGTGALTSGLGTTATDLLTKAGTGLLGGLTAQQLSGLISGGLSTAGGLLQQQTSKEAAQAAQARIDAETAAAKQAAQFRPVGMTTRFGSSQFTYNPTTGQLESAGYTLSPEAKAQQDRLMALSNQGLSQAEQAQAQFAPLQTGAQSLFNLGNKYLAQTPEEVAQRYITQQMNLLQPGRELELANLQNKLQQQGRSGLAVSQGGNYGATTPELQALYNARAMQEAQLAANAQMAGQQQVNFGAGLLGQGAGALGQYYAGQQAAYAPYTTAMGQVQNLETMGQQPFGMSTALAQQQAQAGANAGRLGLTGAQLSAGLATSNAATTNPYATVLGGLGSPTSLLGQGLANWTTGLLSSPTTGTAGNPLAVGEFANPGYWT